MLEENSGAFQHIALLFKVTDYCQKEKEWKILVQQT